MTSIPASRRARAMIFAPRSCRSSPGLATTTRILRSVALMAGGPDLMDVGPPGACRGRSVAAPGERDARHRPHDGRAAERDAGLQPPAEAVQPHHLPAALARDLGERPTR